MAEGGRQLGLTIPPHINVRLSAEIERTGESARAIILRLIKLGKSCSGADMCGRISQREQAEIYAGIVDWPVRGFALVYLFFSLATLRF